jgi:hypothetical protein
MPKARDMWNAQAATSSVHWSGKLEWSVQNEHHSSYPDKLFRIQARHQARNVCVVQPKV